jgi:hypothetical protein
VTAPAHSLSAALCKHQQMLGHLLVCAAGKSWFGSAFFAVEGITPSHFLKKLKDCIANNSIPRNYSPQFFW